MRYALIDRASRLVYLVVELGSVSAALRARWDVVASDSARPGDKWDGYTFEQTGERRQPDHSARYAAAGLNAHARGVDRLPAGEQAAALLKGSKR